ncbi:hypothetical protein RUM43_001288 [Polyplax serrata]|uniref:Histone-lysine N-methyltransferase n=1 Tax=Polyplax serrata TaxID=468196 RepID=A0AAN8XTM9_POLSC
MPPTPPPTPPLTESKAIRRKKHVELASWKENEQFEVEKIVTHDRVNDRLVFLVKWKGWSSAYNTYEPLDNLISCNYLLMKYFERSAPDVSKVRQMTTLIKNRLLENSIYRSLIERNYNRRDLNAFLKSNERLGNKMFSRKMVYADFPCVRKHLVLLEKEFKYLVRCLLAMDTIDQEILQRTDNYLILIKILQRRQNQLKELSAAEAKILKAGDNGIVIRNDVDFDVFPKFRYVVEMKFDRKIKVPIDPPLGCECKGRCREQTYCCGPMAGAMLAYDSSKRLKTFEKVPIYECNKKCKCLKDCRNRVVQNGRSVKLCIFKTKKSGWGVKAMEEIEAGTFVCEYIGEMITESEAIQRDEDNYEKKASYLFDLDFNPDLGSELYCIDTEYYGNVSRFINHSCNPNLIVCPVWVDCLDPNMPRLAFFARRRIMVNEEIAFDYGSRQDDLNASMESSLNEPKNVGKRLIPKIKCACNTANCRKWLF